MKVDYVIISSDDNPLYKDFYPIVAKKWFELGFKTYYINITDTENESICENKWGIIHYMKPAKGLSTGLQSQIVRLFSSNIVDGVLMMSDIDMLPINGTYFRNYLDELTEDNVLIYSGQPYTDVPFYSMCYVVSKSKNLRLYLGIENMNFQEYCDLLGNNYKQAWNTDENFMYDKFQNFKDKLIIKRDRDFSKRIDRSRWGYDVNLLKKGYYIDSHLLRPYDKYFKEVNELLKNSK
jgi:hypothetical protein